MPTPHMSRSAAQLPAGSNTFSTTHWSVVLSAAGVDSLGAKQALEQLCRTYWYPLFCFVRRQGHSAADAEDLTQAFFAHLLERGSLARVTQDKGRFRSFLLASLKYFLADQWDKARAQKRGGGSPVVSLDAEGAEERYQRECSDDLTAERLYERRWAMSVLDRAFDRLRDEFTAAGKATLHDELRRLQDNAADGASYADVATRLEMPVNTLKSHEHRFRQRYRELLCEEVTHTVATPIDIAEEVRHLIAVVSAGS
jgi:RNA polymerase sigma factor (sigma-70 family)